MGKKCLDNIDTVFDHDRIIRDSSLAQFILALKMLRQRGHALLSSLFKIVMGETSPFKMSAY